MKSSLFLFIAILALTGCAPVTQTPVTSGTSSKNDGKTAYSYLHEAVEDYYTIWNEKFGSMNNEAHPSYRTGEFQQAEFTLSNGTMYALVQVLDSNVTPCVDCSPQEWQTLRDSKSRIFENIAKSSKSFRYSIDDERKQISVTMLRVMYGVLRDDEYWWVYSNVQQLGADEVMTGKLIESAKRILGEEYKNY